MAAPILHVLRRKRPVRDLTHVLEGRRALLDRLEVGLMVNHLLIIVVLKTVKEKRSKSFPAERLLLAFLFFNDRIFRTQQFLGQGEGRIMLDPQFSFLGKCLVTCES